MENRSKTNTQVFDEYFDLIRSSKSPKWDYETRRILNQFREHIGEYPPSIELFAQFFQRYLKLAQSTRARYYYVFSAFFDWYNGQELPFRIKAPKLLPQHVDDEDVEKLLAAMRQKRSHKKLLERDVLLVETGYHTGLRRSELSPNLEVGDLQLSGDSPRLLVRHGKGNKDRVVYLNGYIRDRLAAFTKGRGAKESVFGLAPKTVSMKISYWAHKAGVSIHTHSLRHKFATDILERGGNIRAVQQLLGHESLGTTESYLAVTNNGLRDAVNLLDNGLRDKGKPSGDTDDGKLMSHNVQNALGNEVEPVDSAEENRNSQTKDVRSSLRGAAGFTIADLGLASMQRMLDPVNLYPAVDLKQVEELQFTGLPKIDKTAASQLLGLSKKRVGSDKPHHAE